MAKHIEDIGKDAKDLLSQNFPSDGTVKFSTESKNPANFTFKSNLSRSIKKDKTATREAVSATFEDKLEIKDKNIEFNCKITSNKEYSGAVVIKDPVGVGSKVELGVNQNADGIHTSPSVIYKTDSLAIKSKVVYPLSGKKNEIKLFAEAGFHTSNIHAGIGSVVTLDGSKTVIDLEGVSSYAIQNNQITARANHTLNENLIGFGASYFHHYDHATKLAVDVSSDSTLEKVTLTAGGEYKVDTFSTVKGKVTYKQNKKDTDLRAALSLKQQIYPNLSATFGTDLNTRSFWGNETGEPHSFGVELKFENK